MASKLSDYEQSLAKNYWDNFSNESILALQTPLVVALAFGILELDTFRNYAYQDIYFLKYFVRTLELAEKCVVNGDDKRPIRKLRKED